MVPPVSGEPHLKSLTAARFFAAIWVVLYHFWPKEGLGSSLVLRNFVHLGFIGVGFFFVLSGFVLAYIYVPRARSFNRREFYWARFARIYPVYFLSFVLAAVPVLIAVRTHHPAPADLGVKLPAYVLMVQSWLPWYDHELNGAAWTLSVEVLFYLSFPLMLGWLARVSRKGAFWGLTVCALVTLVVPGIAVGMGFTPSLTGFYGNLFRFFPLVHVPAFVFGALLARVYEEDRAAGRYARWALPLGLVLLSLVVAFNRTWFYFFLHDGGLLIPFGLIIYGLAAREGIGGHGRVPKWLILFGDASYGIYILQFPVFAWTFALVARFFGGHRELVGGWEVLAYALFLTGVCVLIYRYFELPVRKAMRRRVGAGNITDARQVN